MFIKKTQKTEQDQPLRTVARLKRVLLTVAAVLLLLVVAYCVFIGIALYQLDQGCSALVQWLMKALGR